jgi:hypothetical protein
LSPSNNSNTDRKRDGYENSLWQLELVKITKLINVECFNLVKSYITSA